MKDNNNSAISSHSLPSYVRNRYKANGGAEFGDEEWSNGSGLEMYETFYRSYNAQIGRFMQGDPMMEVSMESYVFAGNNPIMFNDPFGDLSQAAWDDVLSRFGDGSNLNGFGEYGGYYSEGGGGGGGGFTPFSSDAEAFGWGASQMDANGWWGSQPGWAGSFNEAYQNFSAGSLTEGEKGYNYINAKFSGAYSNSKYTKDVEFERHSGENFYFAGYGNISDFNAIIQGYQTQQGSVDWKGVGSASLGILGGASEWVVGGVGEWFSGGTATPLTVPLFVDGGVRMGSGLTKLIASINGRKDIAEAIPSNIGAAIGKGLDMASGKSFYSYGYGQAIGGGINDVASFVVTGGSAQPMADLMNNPNARNILFYFIALPGYTSGLYDDFSSLNK